MKLKLKLTPRWRLLSVLVAVALVANSLVIFSSRADGLPATVPTVYSATIGANPFATSHPEWVGDTWNGYDPATSETAPWQYQLLRVNDDGTYTVVEPNLFNPVYAGGYLGTNNAADDVTANYMFNYWNMTALAAVRGGGKTSGHAIRFTAPQNGAVTVTIRFEGSELPAGNLMNARLTKNGRTVTITPSSTWSSAAGGWITSTHVTNLPLCSLTLEKGDELRFDTYVSGPDIDAGENKRNLPMQEFSVSFEEPEAVSATGIYPTWSTPAGAYNPAAVPGAGARYWEPEFLTATASGDGYTTVTAAPTSYEPGWDSMLLGPNGGGYHFSNDYGTYFEMANAATAGMGVSLKLNAPFAHMTKLTAVLNGGNMAQGQKLYARITKNGTSLMTDSNGWFVTEHTGTALGNIALPTVLTDLVLGDELRLEVFLLGGACNVSLIQFEAAKSTEEIIGDSVTPIGRDPMKNVADGAYTPPSPPGLFEYQVFEVVSENVLNCTNYESTWDKFLYHGPSFNGYHMAPGGTALLTEVNTNTHGISLALNSPYNGNVSLRLSMGTGEVAADAAMYVRITQDGTTIYPTPDPQTGLGKWAKVGSAQLNAAGDIDFVLSKLVFTAVKDKAIRLEYYFTGNTAANNTQFRPIIWNYTIAKTADPVTPDDLPNPDAVSDSVTPVGKNPMIYQGDIAYTPPTPRGMWEYQVLDVASDTVADCNRYNQGWGNYIYHNAALTGYHLEPTYIHTEPHKSAAGYGAISLKLTSPFDGNVALRLAMGSAQVPRQTVLKLRITKNGTTVYPSAGGWATAGSVQLNASDGTDFALNKLVFAAAKGDAIRLEYYIDGPDCPAALNTNILSYSISKTTAAVADDDLPNPDAEEYIEPLPKDEEPTPFVGPHATYLNYAAMLSNPLKNFNGSIDKTFTADEARWNFELIKVTGGTVTEYKPDYARMAWDSFYFDSVTNNGYHIRGDGVALEPKVVGGNSYGASIRFVSPIAGQAVLTTAASIIRGGGTAYVRVLLNDVQIWPASGWASGNGGVTVPELPMELAIGDELKLQAYAGSMVNDSYGNSPMINFSFPGVVQISDVNTEKTTFIQSVDFIPGLNLDPYWSYIYSRDIVNPTFNKIETYNADPTWRYYLAGGINYLGVNADGWLWVANDNADSQVPDDKYGIAAIAWTSMKNGFVKLKSRQLSVPGQSSASMRARITLNGTTVWPAEGGWTSIGLNGSADIGPEIFEMKAGDVLQFEATTAAGTGAERGGYLIWDPALDFSLTRPAEGDDGGMDALDEWLDIYYGLSEADAARYKAMAGSGEFDLDFLKNKALAARLEEEANRVKPTPTDPSTENQGGEDSADGTDTSVQNPGDGTDTADNTPTQPGSSKKKKVTTYETIVYGGLPTYALILIIAGSVMALGAAAFIILYKKRIIKLPFGKKLKGND